MRLGVGMTIVAFITGCATGDPPELAKGRSVPAPRTPAPESSEAAVVAAELPTADDAGHDAAPMEPPPPDGMLLVPAGKFVMGAVDWGELDERPAHEVELPAFFLDANEVTNEDYGRCVEAGVCRAPTPDSAEKNKVGPDSRFRGPKQPVSSISWEDAKTFCSWNGKRLPTEAEWERAARGDDARRFPWGEEEPTAAHATFRSSVTTDVGTHPDGDGPFGHHDLAGNVWEWVDDVYDPFAYEREGAARGVGGSCEASLRAFDELRRTKRDGFTGANPIPDECERVLRGGAFNYPGHGLRATNRVHHPPRFRLVMSGFRCAVSP